MDIKLSLLNEFYRGLCRDRAKVESYEHGFDFLDGLLAGGATMEYAEMSLTGMLHKYKVSQIPEWRMNELLEAHIRKVLNVCLYFDDTANRLFCINLDNNHKTNNTVVIPEMELAVRLLRENLIKLGCEPLVIASGRGFHLWGRLEAAIENERLHNLMLRSMARTFLGCHQQGYDHREIKANFYPDPRARDVVSLRLFGSRHVKNKVFSRVLTPDGLLDEQESWEAFERYMKEKTIRVETFDRAYETVMA